MWGRKPACSFRNGPKPSSNSRSRCCGRSPLSGHSPRSRRFQGRQITDRGLCRRSPRKSESRLSSFSVRVQVRLTSSLINALGFRERKMHARRHEVCRQSMARMRIGVRPILGTPFRTCSKANTIPMDGTYPRRRSVTFGSRVVRSCTGM